MKKRFYFLFICSLIIICSCGDGSSTDSSGGNGSGGSGNEFSHIELTGSSAGAFLSAENFDALTIEVDYIEGQQPTQTALNNIVSFLENRLNKPNGITIQLSDAIPAPGISGYTAEQIYNLEKEYRDQFTSGSSLAAYVIMMNDEYQQSNVLGVAYLNTSLALFEQVIKDNTGGLGQPATSTIESTVLRHEFGHLLGLVGNGTPAIQDHVDEDHGAHCTAESCLMYYETRTTSIMGNLTGGEIPALDDQCIQDLQANGGK